MLPSTPIQILLARACGPLVMTSANPTDEQLIFQDDAMLDFGRSQPLLAGILTHDRPVLTGLDDSVVRWTSRLRLLRRSRGYVPLAINLAADSLAAEKTPHTILALGADLKATTAYAHAGFAWLSQPAGDLSRPQAAEAWLTQTLRLGQLLNLTPDLICTDLHPGYFSRTAAESVWPDCQVRPFQHHHAHIASVMAEHHLCGPIIGVAFDGTGYGSDGTVWGGEFLLCDGPVFRRAAHFQPIYLPGGDAGMRDAWRSLAGYLEAAGLEDPNWLFPEADTALGSRKGLGQAGPDAATFALLRSAVRAGIHTVANSSVGRLFDAVCALLGLGLINHYEGECGSRLEWQAMRARDNGWSAWPLAFTIQSAGTNPETLTVNPLPAIRDLYEVLAGQRDEETVARLALGFHQALSDAVIQVASQIRARTSISQVAVSGGVFQNALRTELLEPGLLQAGFSLYFNEQVPPHDGGICLGQAWLGLLSGEES
jgi:hydrogenase maturation protein HypF